MNISRDFPRTTLIVAAAILLPFALTACNSSSNANPDKPVVSSTHPADDAENVPLNHQITATFSVAMDEASINDVSFSAVGTGESALTDTVTLDAESNTATATFAPDTGFTADTEYTATVSSDVISTAGVALASDYTWSFTSGAEADTTSPEVVLTEPDSDATYVVLDAKVTVTFTGTGRNRKDTHRGTGRTPTGQEANRNEQEGHPLLLLTFV